MALRLTETYYAPCSCNVDCPCTFGELEGDRDWFSSVAILDVRDGAVDVPM